MRDPNRFQRHGTIGRWARARLSSFLSVSWLAMAAPLAMGVDDCDGGELPCSGDECVTGCFFDGEHYDVGESFPDADGCNTCSCSEGGAVFCTLRACLPDTCGGLAGLGCDAGEYCDYPLDAQCGAADQTGFCRAQPEVCLEVYEPVCGCDDRTYGNECEAASNGISVAYEGECGVPEGTCGGIAGLGCDDGEYCDYAPEAQCGALDQTGVCRVPPEACILVYDPVCGCDGNTYGNSCGAASAGVSVLHAGECEAPSEGPFCGGFAGIACPGEGKCVDDPGDDCDPAQGGADCGGLCECNANAACLPGTVWDGSPEVCACVPDFGAACGGLAGVACADGEFCDYPPKAQCGAADQMGTCRVVPQVCTKIFLPVCGCDGETYGNECEAASNGVSVVHAGEC